MGKSFAKSLVDSIQRKRSVSYLAERYGRSEEEILGELTRLQINGYTNLKIWKDGDIYFAQNNGKVKPKRNVYDLKCLFRAHGDIDVCRDR